MRSRDIRKRCRSLGLRHNGNLKADAITRIKTALEEFVAAAAPFKITELEQRTGCSRSTLYKHSALWQPLYLELKRLPEKSSDEYNAVGGAAASQASSLPASSVPDISPGRLAARRVVQALSSKAFPDPRNSHQYLSSVIEKHEEKWRTKVVAAVPPDLMALDARELKTTLPILLSLLAQAPDEEAQKWLQREVRIIRERLDELRKSWAETAVQRLELSG